MEGVAFPPSLRACMAVMAGARHARGRLCSISQVCQEDSHPDNAIIAG